MKNSTGTTKAELQQQTAELTKRVRDLEQGNMNLMEKLADRDRELCITKQSLNNLRDDLKELNARDEGFKEGIRFVLEMLPLKQPGGG